MLVLTRDVTAEQIEVIMGQIGRMGLNSRLVEGEHARTLQVIGDETGVDLESLAGLPGVESVSPVDKPYKLVARTLHPVYSGNGAQRVVKMGNVAIGDGSLVIAAGPCAVYTLQQTLETARSVRAAGGVLLRGGAYKPRTSPHSFQGLREDGLKMLAEARAATGLYIVTEVLDPRDVEVVGRYADMFQTGTRNMQNFELLREVGRTGMPVLLKRGFSSTLEEWLSAAEYVAAEGNMNIVLCERGMRTPYSGSENGRFNLDIQAIPAAHGLSILPVMADPSHATGRRNMVIPIALAAVAAGADGLLLDVRREEDLPTIEYARDGRGRMTQYVDYQQALVPHQLELLVEQAFAVHRAVAANHLAAAYH